MSSEFESEVSFTMVESERQKKLSDNQITVHRDYIQYKKRFPEYFYCLIASKQF